MTHHTGYEPYIERNPGDLITAEDWNEMQQYVKADLADNATADDERHQQLLKQIAEVDAAKFGSKTPEEWTDDLDGRYVKRDDPQAAGEYRRYFKQVDKGLADGTIEPAVIEHKLCRFPIVEVYELNRLFDEDPLAGEADPVFDWQTIKFLVYYASKRDPIAELLRTESADWYYWGDPLPFWLDRFRVQPALTQAFDDLLNDLWGHMFDPGLEQDEFTNVSYGHTPYVQRWIDGDKSVDDLLKGGQWDDLDVAIRPQLVSPNLAASVTMSQAFMEERNMAEEDLAALLDALGSVQVFHLSQNAIEIRVPKPMDLMVLLRT